MSRKSLGEFEYLVLMAALRLGEDEAYAVSIVDEIGERAERVVERAAVYVALQRLEKKRLVSTRLGEPLKERGGKARRYVKVESLGLREVQARYRLLARMTSGLEPLMESPQ